MSLSLLKPQPSESECRGIFLKAHVSVYLAKDGSLNANQKLKVLKRRSCSGCSHCGGLYEAFREAAYDGRFPVYEQLTDGKVYMLALEITSTDWETGIPDDYDLVLKEVDYET